MRRRVLLEVLGVTAVAAIFSPCLAPAMDLREFPAGWNVCGVQPWMSRADVEARLGAPDYAGSLPVANNRQGTYVEYGSPKPTWNGRPTIVYDEDGTVISVVGDRACVGDLERFRCGDFDKKVIGITGSDAACEMYPPDRHLSRKLLEGDLELSFSNGQLTRMILCRHRCQD